MTMAVYCSTVTGCLDLICACIFLAILTAFHLKYLNWVTV